MATLHVRGGGLAACHAGRGCDRRDIPIAVGEDPACAQAGVVVVRRFHVVD